VIHRAATRSGGYPLISEASYRNWFVLSGNVSVKRRAALRNKQKTVFVGLLERVFLRHGERLCCYREGHAMASIGICNIDQLNARTRPEPEKLDVSASKQIRQARLASPRERLAAPPRVKVLLEDL
jgi:hypothetical protein